MHQTSGKILIVEDDEALREVTAIVLRERGFEVIEVSDPNDVLRVLQSHREIDVLLTDLIMPGKFGHDVALEFNRVFPNAKVIVMSGFGLEGFSKHLKDLGYKFLAKPVSVNELLKAIHSAIGGEKYDNRIAS